MNLLSVASVSKHKLHKKILQKQRLPHMSISRQSSLTDGSAIYKAFGVAILDTKEARLPNSNAIFIFLKENSIQILFFNEFLHISI